MNANTPVAKMNVEIWSDVVCPFCYIGKRKFEAALAQFADRAQIEVIWKSYQLQPDMAEGYDKSAYELVAEKYGIPMEQSQTMHRQVAQSAAAVGLEYNFDIARPANTFKAHQLLQFAKAAGKSDEAEEALFRAYFTEGKNIGDQNTLVSIGASIGLDEAALQQAIDQETYAAHVHADIAEAQQIGVRGVPFFVVDRSYGVSGAQEPGVFLQTLEQAFSDWRQAQRDSGLQVTDGAVCTPEGGCE